MPFAPGKSGNPGGRPKAQADLLNAARAHTEKSIAVLAKALNDDDARVRIKAAEVLLDRAWGKPAQSLAISNDGDQPFVQRIERIFIDATSGNAAPTHS
jgi:hypothetical protein